MASSRLRFFSFSIPPTFSMEKLVESLMSRNDELSRFVINDYGDDFLDGYYLVQQKKLERIYSFASSTFETVETTKSVTSLFSVDASRKLLVISGNGTVATRLLTLFSLSTQNATTIDVLEPDLSSMIGKIIDRADVSARRVKIDDIPLENGIVAKCIIELANHEDVNDFIRKHADSIAQIILVLSPEDSEDVTCTLYRSGSIVIHKSLEALYTDGIFSVYDIIFNI